MNIKKGLRTLILLLLIFQINVYALNKAVVDITKMDINEISEALELKLITSEELVNLYLDRINEYDKNYNSIITINESALEEAKRLDEERSNGSVRSILHGIPIVVKDNIDVKGMPTTGGAKALKDNYPNENAFIIQKLIDAGAIIIAKTNMSEFAFYANSSISSYGKVNNAYNADYSSYGSSGGSAVAVAASFAAAGLGSDTNSSVRLPASANNVVGLRPTIGLLSRSGIIPYDTQRDTPGPLTKTVTDAVILMNIMNGYDANDSLSIDQEKANYELTMKTLEGITIGIPTDFLEGSDSNGLAENKATYKDILKLMEDAISKLEANGANIVYLDKYYTYSTDGWNLNSVSGYTFCDGFNKYIKNTTGSVRSFSDLANSSAKITWIGGYLNSCNSSKTFTNANSLKANFRSYVEGIMENNKLDVIVYPSSKNKLLKNNNYEGLLNLTAHASSTINYPAISLPLGFDEEGLPYGIEFMVPTNQEELLLNIVSVYENINSNDKTPEIAPNLYEVSEDTEKLIENYKKLYSKKNHYNFESNWLKDVQNYFRNYSQSDSINEDAQSLNLKYLSIKGLASLLVGLLFIIKWILLIIGTFIIFLLIRKFIRRALRRRRRKRKRK